MHGWLPGGQKNFGPGRPEKKLLGPGRAKKNCSDRAGQEKNCSGRAGLKNFCSGRARRAEKMCSGKRQNKKTCSKFMYFFFLEFAARYGPGSMGLKKFPQAGPKKNYPGRAGQKKNCSGRAGQLFLAARPGDPGRLAANYGRGAD